MFLANDFKLTFSLDETQIFKKVIKEHLENIKTFSCEVHAVSAAKWLSMHFI